MSTQSIPGCGLVHNSDSDFKYMVLHVIHYILHVCLFELIMIVCIVEYALYGPFNWK